MTENINEPENKDTLSEWAEELGIDAPATATSVEPEPDVTEEVTEELIEELSSVKKNAIFEMPTFNTGFRGFDKNEVESFLKNIIKAYNDIASKENVDSSVLINANKVIKANVKKIETLEKKIANLEKDKDANATQKLIDAAEKKAAAIVAKAEADAKKHKESFIKIEAAAQAKADKIIDAANAKAIKALEKAVADASKIVENGKKEILESRRVIAKNKETNERLIAFYTTQIKTLKEQNKKNTK